MHNIHHNIIMHIEDITRLKRSDDVINHRNNIEDEQRTLVKQLNQLIKQRTVGASERINKVLRQVIDLIKQN